MCCAYIQSSIRMNNSTRVAERKSRRELAAVVTIQRSYRRYLKRMYGAALSDAFLANKYLKFIAATVCMYV